MNNLYTHQLVFQHANTWQPFTCACLPVIPAFSSTNHSFIRASYSLMHTLLPVQDFQACITKRSYCNSYMWTQFYEWFIDKLHVSIGYTRYRGFMCPCLLVKNSAIFRYFTNNTQSVIQKAEAKEKYSGPYDLRPPIHQAQYGLKLKVV